MSQLLKQVQGDITVTKAGAGVVTIIEAGAG